MDLSETQDLSALVLVGNLDGRTLIFPKFYLPKDNIVSKSKKDGANYLAWAFKNDTSFCAFFAVRLKVSGSIEIP
jgi:phage terminase large subunit-like protein